jgi:hypothetical protein
MSFFGKLSGKSRKHDKHHQQELFPSLTLGDADLLKRENALHHYQDDLVRNSVVMLRRQSFTTGSAGGRAMAASLMPTATTLQSSQQRLMLQQQQQQHYYSPVPTPQQKTLKPKRKKTKLRLPSAGSKGSDKLAQPKPSVSGGGGGINAIKTQQEYQQEKFYAQQQEAFAQDVQTQKENVLDNVKQLYDKHYGKSSEKKQQQPLQQQQQQVEVVRSVDQLVEHLQRTDARMMQLTAQVEKLTTNVHGLVTESRLRLEEEQRQRQARAEAEAASEEDASCIDGNKCVLF